jgi:transcriptional regulator NrdR family protein
MGEMVKRVGYYEMRFEDLAQENVAVIKRLDERDKQLAEALDTIRQLEEKNGAATKHDIDAMLILADVLGELIQLSNIPQVKKDAIYSKHETAKNHIVSEMEKEKEHEENEN